MTAPAIIGDTETRVLLALIDETTERGRAAVRPVADRARIPYMTAHAALVRLRSRGLVAWNPHHAATLRPLVTIVARDTTNP